VYECCYRTVRYRRNIKVSGNIVESGKLKQYTPLTPSKEGWKAPAKRIGPGYEKDQQSSLLRQHTNRG